MSSPFLGAGNWRHLLVDQRGLALEVTAPADGQGLLALVFGDRSAAASAGTVSGQKNFIAVR